MAYNGSTAGTTPQGATIDMAELVVFPLVAEAQERKMVVEAVRTESFKLVSSSFSSLFGYKPLAEVEHQLYVTREDGSYAFNFGCAKALQDPAEAVRTLFTLMDGSRSGPNPSDDLAVERSVKAFEDFRARQEESRMAGDRE